MKTVFYKTFNNHNKILVGLLMIMNKIMNNKISKLIIMKNLKIKKINMI